MRFLKNETKSIIHTPENVLNKLNKDLTDFERKSVLVLLLQSKDTIDVLISVIQTWEQLLNKQKIDILTLEENIRVCEDSLKLSDKYRIVEGHESTLQKIKEDKLRLIFLKTNHEKCTGLAIKTMTIMDDILYDEKSAQENLDGVSSLQI